MENIKKLWDNHTGSQLLMTTLAAGNMGPSWQPGHPGKLAVYDELEIDPGRIIFVEQKHTKQVALARTLVRGISRPEKEADGIISSNPDDILGVTAADCMPVFLYDRSEGVRALLHSGWKGTGIAAEALRIMKNEFGCRAQNIEAVLGPAIGSCCYNVDEERAEEFAETWGPESVVRHDGRSYLSLSGANCRMLKDEGITNVTDVGECTSCSGSLGSFRREGAESFTLMMVLSIGC